MIAIPKAFISSGDLLLWKNSKTSKLSDILLKGISYAMKSEYSHVGIAWRLNDAIDDELFVIEATLPKINIARVSDEEEYYCVPISVNWEEKNKNFIIDKVGLPYGLSDAIRTYFGFVLERDDRWQCFELAHAFLEQSGIYLPYDFRPTQFIENVKKTLNTEVFSIAK